MLVCVVFDHCQAFARVLPVTRVKGTPRRGGRRGIELAHTGFAVTYDIKDFLGNFSRKR